MKTDPVGPFPEGTYMLYVTLGEGVYDIQGWSCIVLPI